MPCAHKAVICAWLTPAGCKVPLSSSLSRLSTGSEKYNAVCGYGRTAWLRRISTEIGDENC